VKVKIARWGNSVAVRLPKRLADELGLTPGREVDIDRQGTQLRIEAAEVPRIPHYRLEDLLAQSKPGQKSPPLEGWGILPTEWPQDDWGDIAPTDEEWNVWLQDKEKKGGK
jgi:antitoxin MazE